MAQTVVGIFDTASEAQNAVEALVNSGFSRDQIDLSTRSSDYTYDQGSTTSSSFSTTTTTDTTRDEGGIGGFFRSLFGDDDDDRTNRYSTVGERGSIVTVHATSEDYAERAADILDEYGAVDVDERATQYGYGSQGYVATTGSTTTTGINDLTVGTTQTTGVVNEGETISVPIIEENLQVGKQTVQTGGVRVRSRIIERPVEEHLRLRSERVIIQRNPVDRTATKADFTTFREGEVELTEHAERAVVAKEARVVEEVTVGKQVDERDEVIQDTVRRTDVDVEQVNPTLHTSTTNNK
jgi:uncharacterized protein (TIGR02271 family)